MVGSGPDVAVLLAGVAVVVVNGQLLLRNGPAYLELGDRDQRHARRSAGLVAVFFHLVMFGVVALVASVGFAGDPPLASVVSRIGVLLLLTAGGHALALFALGRLRDERKATEMADAQVAAAQSRRSRGPRPPAPGPRAVAVNTPADAPGK